MRKRKVFLLFSPILLILMGFLLLNLIGLLSDGLAESAWAQRRLYTVNFDLSADERGGAFDKKPPSEFCAQIKLYDRNKRRIDNVVYKYGFESNKTKQVYQKITRRTARVSGSGPVYFSLFLYENDLGPQLRYDKSRWRDSDDIIWEEKWTYKTSTDRVVWGSSHFLQVDRKNTNNKLFRCGQNNFYCFRNPRDKTSMGSWWDAKDKRGHVKVRVW